MLKKFLCLVLFNAATACYAEHSIHPAKYADQEEILEKGGMMLLSKKNNDILMYQTQETIKKSRANFFFTISNFSDKTINLYTHNVRATDQWGRPIRIVPKRELIKNKKKETGWQLFSSGIISCIESDEANRAGKVTYRENTHAREHTHYRHRGGRTSASGVVDTHLDSTTYGSIHNEAERQRALRAVRHESALREQAILNQQAHFEEGMQNNYFDAETIYPEEIFSANVQIEVPKNILKDLEFILFHFDLGEEQHSFAFHTEEM